MNERTTNKSKYAETQSEPLFMAVRESDSDLQAAYACAAATIPHFIEELNRGGSGFYMAKLRFRDPEWSERVGENKFMFLWLTDVHYHAAERVFSGEFFEVPPEFQKWHQDGKRLGFDPEDIFDWAVIRQGRLNGGFTMRVQREHLPEMERDAYDRYVGISFYEPLPT
jgi:uncharacterized protein YegJ (DUF2314 family)